MKITFVSHSSGLLGASRSILPIIAECDRRGMKVDVLSHGDGPFVSEIKRMGLHTTLLLASDLRKFLPRNLLRFLYTLPNFIFLFMRLRVSRPDLVYVNTIDKALPVIVARLLKIPTIVHVREGKDYINSADFARRVLSKLIFSSACHFICVSKETSERVGATISRSKKNSTCVCIYNGVKLTGKKIDDFEAYRSEDTDTVRVGFVGGGSRRKRLDVFLGGLGLAQTRNSALQGIVVGPSKREFRDALQLADRYCCESLKLEHLEFQEDISDIMSSLDVLCLTSDVEAFGRVIIEAAHFNVPVIASNVTGPSEIILNNVSGLLFNRGDISDLAEKILKLSQYPELRREYGEAMAVRADTFFSEENYVMKCLNEIQTYGPV